VEFPASGMATDATRIDGACPGRAPRKRPNRITRRRYLPPKIDRRSRVGRRVKELQATFIAALEAQGREMTAVLSLNVQRASEALAMAEDARQRFLRGEGSVRLDAIATVERLAERAVAKLRLADAEKPRAPSLLAYLAQKAAAE
jgi:hypothetical protein